MTDFQLARYAELIYARTGIRVSPQKRALLSNRVRRRLRAAGIEGFEEYYRHLRQLSPRDDEWDAFLQEITTHETYLFRDQTQWDWFLAAFLPARAERGRPGGWHTCESGRPRAAPETRRLPRPAASQHACRIWPNGKFRSSEPTLAAGRFEQAQAASFGERAMRLVPDPYRRLYFTKAKNADLWHAKPVLTEMVQFPATQPAGTVHREAVRPRAAEERSDLLRSRLEETRAREHRSGAATGRNAGRRNRRGSVRYVAGLPTVGVLAVAQTGGPRRRQRPKMNTDAIHHGDFAHLEDDWDSASRYLSIFIDECQETLDELTQALLALEAGKGAEGLEPLFVAAHRIKGSAASIGLNRPAKLAHLMEDLLQVLVDEGRSLRTEDGRRPAGLHGRSAAVRSIAACGPARDRSVRRAGAATARRRDAPTASRLPRGRRLHRHRPIPPRRRTPSQCLRASTSASTGKWLPRSARRSGTAS